MLSAALVLDDPESFLREGDHEFDEILEIPLREQPVEIPAPTGVN